MQNYTWCSAAKKKLIFKILYVIFPGLTPGNYTALPGRPHGWGLLLSQSGAGVGGWSFNCNSCRKLPPPPLASHTHRHICNPSLGACIQRPHYSWGQKVGGSLTEVLFSLNPSYTRCLWFGALWQWDDASCLCYVHLTLIRCCSTGHERPRTHFASCSHGYSNNSDPLEKEMPTHSRILVWKSHGQRSLVGYIVPRVAKSWTQLRDSKATWFFM